MRCDWCGRPLRNAPQVWEGFAFGPVCYSRIRRLDALAEGTEPRSEPGSLPGSDDEVDMLATDGRAIPTTPELTADGRWLETCACGRETRIKNGGLRIIPALAPLNDCALDHPGRPVKALLAAEMGWLTDSDAPGLDVEMLDYLRYANDPQAHKSPDGLRDHFVMAYVAAGLGWTEGTALYLAWLNADGQEAFVNYTAQLA